MRFTEFELTSFQISNYFDIKYYQNVKTWKMLSWVLVVVATIQDVLIIWVWQVWDCKTSSIANESDFVTLIFFE